MSFKSKLIISFSIIIIIPMILFSAAFFVIGSALARANGEDRLGSFSALSGDTARETQIDDIVTRIGEDLEADPAVAEDAEYLDRMSSELSGTNSYIIVRRNGFIRYAGNETDAERIRYRLPRFGSAAAEEKNGIYLNRLNRVVRQLDFYFPDGAAGTLFVVTSVAGIISGDFLAGMLAAALLTLIITAVLLTQWLRSSLFEPVNRLNVAMNNIRDGNLEYILNTSEKGEIGELYRNYEDMRLRLKESADEKLENDRHDRELISNISHDLKTPITSIKGYVEGLMDGVANTPEKQEKYLRTIYNKANDMNNLINELTLYSRIDNNKIPYNFQKINIAGYFGDCVEEIGMDMESRGIELNYSNLVSPDTQIIADPEQLKRVINNIIGNSVKYMDKNRPKIDIRILDEQDSVRIEIEDNGKGIAPRDLPNIFDRFFRTDSSRNSAQGGSGIGLSIVKKIIEDHGGYIWATSREGLGTCLHFVLRKYRETDRAGVQVDSESADAS